MQCSVFGRLSGIVTAEQTSPIWLRVATKINFQMPMTAGWARQEASLSLSLHAAIVVIHFAGLRSDLPMNHVAGSACFQESACGAVENSAWYHLVAVVALYRSSQSSPRRCISDCSPKGERWFAYLIRMAVCLVGSAYQTGITEVTD